MELDRYFDQFGPELVYEVYNPPIGLRGMVVIDNTVLGPGKGGIRMTPTVDTAEVFKLARTMTWKNALAGLPFGGAKSGIIFDPKVHSLDQKKSIIEAFSRALKPICPRKYIAGPDINTGEHEMSWFATVNGSWKSCTGKPATMCKGEMCGIPHEYGSTGFGVAHSTAVAAKLANIELKDARIAIDGFGNVGVFAASNLSKMGAKIVALSDSHGTIYSPDGLNPREVEETKKQSGSVTNHKTGTVLKSSDLFELDVDVIIPASIPDVINEKNVDKIKAKMVVEGANIPMTSEIETRLHKKGILVVPDLVANAGGVVSSYAEYRGYHPKDMFSLVERKISRNTALVLRKAKQESLTPRDAAMAIAISRIKRMMEKRRIMPKNITDDTKINS
jgi:glutamate dehydrogenase/leucine dehydrogenase